MKWLLTKEVQEILTKFETLKSRQIEDTLPVLLINVEQDGSFSITDQKNEKLMFDSGEKALEYLENNSDGKRIEFDYINSLPDKLYIDGVLLFCMNQDERKIYL